MKRIDTRKTKAAGRTVGLVLALAVAAVAIFFYASSGRPVAGAIQPPVAEDATTVPEDKDLWLTVPRMARVEDLPVLTGPADDEAALAESALHVAGTGLPWQEEANVYIAGHRIGFEGERSHLVFYDLDALQKGDEVVLTDADGTRYVYRVFRSFVVGPSDFYVTFPTPGKNIVSLQTCTPIPTFEQRLVVQAELADVDPA
ncbi:MAG: class E sortase [Actinomycetota bacterium]|nr:class E sortase [Actinomycetota bacterium]